MTNKGKLFNVKGDSFMIARINLEDILNEAMMEWKAIDKEAEEKPLDGWLVLHLKNEWFNKWIGS